MKLKELAEAKERKLRELQAEKEKEERAAERHVHEERAEKEEESQTRSTVKAMRNATTKTEFETTTIKVLDSYKGI